MSFTHAEIMPDGTVVSFRTGVEGVEDSSTIVELLTPIEHWPQPPHDKAVPAVELDGSIVWRDGRTIEEAKTAKKVYINESKILANQSFTYLDKQIQADDPSWKEIMGTHGWVIATQSLPPGFPMQWKTSDNTYVPITNVTEWLQFYGAALQRGVLNFQKAQELKQLLADATTLEEIDDISW